MDLVVIGTSEKQAEIIKKSVLESDEIPLLFAIRNDYNRKAYRQGDCEHFTTLMGLIKGDLSNDKLSDPACLNTSIIYQMMISMLSKFIHIKIMKLFVIFLFSAFSCLHQIRILTLLNLLVGQAKGGRSNRLMAVSVVFE